MSFAAEYRQGKKDSQTFEFVAYAACGLFGCAVVGVVTVGVMIWNTPYDKPAGQEAYASARATPAAALASSSNSRGRKP